MNRWKIAFFITAGLLLTSNAFLLYTVVDKDVRLGWASNACDHQQVFAEELRRLFIKSAEHHTKADILRLLKEVKADAPIWDNPDTIETRGLSFRFEGDRLTEVHVQPSNSKAHLSCPSLDLRRQRVIASPTP